MTTAGFATARLTADERDRRWRHDRAFYGLLTLAAALVVFGGFARSYYLRPFTDAPGFPPLVELHAALFSSWMVLFAVQASLVTARRTDLHRRLGVLGIGLAVALLVTGYLTAVTGARTGWAGPRVPRDAAAALPFLTIPFGDLMLFAGFFSAALKGRLLRRPS